MAKSFRELGKKAENLIEQGREADQKVQSCQARVSAASSRVAAARSQLAAASETDEEGRPQGDVEQARVQLRVAEGQLAASRRALTEAQGAVGRIKQEKTAHVREIEQHNKTERSNLEKLRQLRSGAFGENAAAMSEGIAQRLNEAEDARAALLRSMGMEATPDYVTVGEGGGGTTTWLGGSFAFMDTSGQAEQYQGTGMGGGVAAPVGGGLGSGLDPYAAAAFGGAGTVGAAAAGAAPEGAAAPHVSADGVTPITPAGTVAAAAREGAPRAPTTPQEVLQGRIDRLMQSLDNSSMSKAERISVLNGVKNYLNCLQQLAMAQQDADERGPVKVLRKPPQQIAEEGQRYIEGMLDAYRDNLIQQGVPEGRTLDTYLQSVRSNFSSILNDDVRNGTFRLSDEPVPNFETLAAELKARDLKDVEQQLKTTFGASVVQLNGFDAKVAHDMANALNEAKKDFPDLHVSYFGSCQSQASSIRQDLTAHYRKQLQSIRQSSWTDEQYHQVVQATVDQYLAKSGLEDTNGTFAWSVSFNGGDVTGGKLGKYSGVAVNLDYASDYQQFRNAKIEEVKTRHKPIGCDTPRATMDHELGHEIDRIVGASQDPKIIGMYRKMLHEGNARDVLSGYSEKNIKEFIAEGYSEYRNNPNPRTYARQIYQRLIELRDLKKGGK